MYAAMQDVHVFPKHLNDCLLLCVMTVAHDVLMSLKYLETNVKNPVNESVVLFFFDDPPSYTMDCLRVIPTEDGNKGEGKLVGA